MVAHRGDRKRRSEDREEQRSGLGLASSEADRQRSGRGRRDHDPAHSRQRAPSGKTEKHAAEHGENQRPEERRQQLEPNRGLGRERKREKRGGNRVAESRSLLLLAGGTVREHRPRASVSQSRHQPEQTRNQRRVGHSAKQETAAEGQDRPAGQSGASTEAGDFREARGFGSGLRGWPGQADRLSRSPRFEFGGPGRYRPLDGSEPILDPGDQRRQAL